MRRDTLPPVEQTSKDFMARNGIWVHLAVIKRRRCKELSVTPSSSRVGVFHPTRKFTLGDTDAFTRPLRPVTAIVLVKLKQNKCYSLHVSESFNFFLYTGKP